MTSRDRDIFRKYESGSNKRLKQQQKKDFLNTQRGSFDKFLKLTQETNELTENKNDKTDISTNIPEQKNTLINELSDKSHNNLSISDISNNIPEPQNSLIDQPSNNIHNNLCVSESTSLFEENSIKTSIFSDKYKISTENVNSFTLAVTDVITDLTDPGNWPLKLNHDVRTDIVKIGPLKVKNYNYPSNFDSCDQRKFSDYYYSRRLPNGENIDRNWLVYSKIKNCVYCFYCKLFPKSINGLNTTGINDWRHLSTILSKHENSSHHLQSFHSWYELKIRIDKFSTIDNAHIRMIQEEKSHWRNVLKRIIAAVQYLANNNDAFRGCSDVLYQPNNGKFLGIIEMLAKFDPVVSEHVRRIKDNETHVHYLGHDTQNTIISMMSNEIKGKMIELIKKSKYFTVIMDTTPDLSHQEQLAFVIRIVHMDNENESSCPEIKEYFMDFINISSTTGLDLSNVLNEKLKEYGLDINNCRGQAYDNGANMSGHYKGVQAQILKQNPRAFFVPCAAHSLNLCLKDAGGSSSTAKLFFGTIERIYVLFSASINRWEILKKHCTKLSIKKWAETRWDSRLNAVKAIRFQLSETIDALEEVSEATNDLKIKSETHSLANEMRGYEFVLSIIIWYDVLSEVNIVSKSLQSIKIDLDTSTSLLNGLIHFLEKYRLDGYLSAKTKAQEITKILGIDAKFKKKRIKKKKVMFSYESPDDIIDDEEENFRQKYFLVIIDQTLTSIKTRFKQLTLYNEQFGFLYRISKLKNMKEEELFKNCQDLQITLSDGNSIDIEAADLCSELIIFCSLVDENTTALQALQILKTSCGSFPNTTIALRILLTIPVTSTGAERAFSKLKIIKNYLRSSISQERLSGLATLSIEKELAETLDYDHIVDQFATQKARKKQFN